MHSRAKLIFRRIWSYQAFSLSVLTSIPPYWSFSQGYGARSLGVKKFGLQPASKQIMKERIGFLGSMQ
jgi:hypothetical protein